MGPPQVHAPLRQVVLTCEADDETRWSTGNFGLKLAKRLLEIRGRIVRGPRAHFSHLELQPAMLMDDARSRL